LHVLCSSFAAIQIDLCVASNSRIQCFHYNFVMKKMTSVNSYTTYSIATMYVCNICTSSFDEDELFCGCVSEENAIGLIGYNKHDIVIEWIHNGLVDPYKICNNSDGWCVYTEAKAWEIDDVCNACLAVSPAPDFFFPSYKDIAPTLLYQPNYNLGSEPLAIENNQPDSDSDFDLW